MRKWMIIAILCVSAIAQGEVNEWAGGSPQDSYSVEEWAGGSPMVAIDGTAEAPAEVGQLIFIMSGGALIWYVRVTKNGKETKWKR